MATLPSITSVQDQVRLAEGLQVILDITRKMAGSLSPDEILQTICIACKKLLDANDTTIMGLDEAGNVLIPLFTDDQEHMESLMNFRLPVGEGLTGHVVLTGKAEIVNDPDRSPLVVQVPGTPEDTLEVLMCVPLLAAERTLGAITVTRPLGRPFTGGELEMLSILGGQAAALLSGARLVSELAKSELKFRSLVENAEIGLFRLDLEGRILSINPYIRRLLHISETDPEPRRIWGSEKTYQNYLKRIDEESALSEFHCRTMCGDGEVRELMISGRRFTELGYIEGVLRDITAWRRLEYENQSRLRFLENLLYNLPQALVIRDPEGRIVGSNPAFDAIFRDERGEPEGEYARFNQMLKELKEIRPLLKDCLRGHNRHLDECKIPAVYLGSEEDGFFSITSVPIMNPEGLLTEGVLLFENVGERRNLRNQLVQSQKMESVGSLAGGIAHDFNTILDGILGNASYLREQNTDNNVAIEHLNLIERAVSRAGQLTRQLLGFAQKGSEVNAPVDLNQVIEHTLRLFQRGVRPNIQLLKEQNPLLPSIRGDSMQLEQALLNLLLNAVDSIESQGTITIRSRKRIIDEVEEEQSKLTVGEYVELEVQDTGSGISDENLQRIFDPFYSTKKGGKSSGLGLTMVYNIVRSHDGHVLVASRKGFGTRVRLLFPMAGTEATSPDVHENRAASAMIWVVDDDRVLRDMLRRILESQDYQVKTFESGEEMLSAFREADETPDLLIIDMLMRGMSGLETHEELMRRAPDSRVLFCSGYSRTQKSEMLSMPGVRGFVEKPFTLTGLVMVVKQALE